MAAQFSRHANRFPNLLRHRRPKQKNAKPREIALKNPLGSWRWKISERGGGIYVRPNSAFSRELKRIALELSPGERAVLVRGFPNSNTRIRLHMTRLDETRNNGRLYRIENSGFEGMEQIAEKAKESRPKEFKLSATPKFLVGPDGYLLDSEPALREIRAAMRGMPAGSVASFTRESKEFGTVFGITVRKENTPVGVLFRALLGSASGKAGSA